MKIKLQVIVHAVWYSLTWYEAYTDISNKYQPLVYELSSR